MEHLADSRLAAIADGARANADEAIHLAQCRECAAVHAELVQLRITGIVGGPDPAPVEVLAAGHQFVEDRRGAQHEPRRRPGISPWRRGLFRIAPALVAVALLMVFIGRGGSPEIELPEASRLVLVEQSTEAGQVHPLVPADRAIVGVSERGPQLNPQATEDLEAARLASDLESVEAIAARVAVLQTSAGDHQLARDILDEAMLEHRQQEIFRQLDLYQLSLEGEFEELEDRLEDRVSNHPEDRLARLNLAILLSKRGDAASRAEAADLVQELVGDGDSVMETRARLIAGVAHP